jgi:hypothetical protein
MIRIRTAERVTEGIKAALDQMSQLGQGGPYGQSSSEHRTLADVHVTTR